MKRKQKPSRTATKLSQHVSELRWRLLACAVALVVGGAITYVFREQVYQLLQLPLSTPLYYTTPGGSFSFIMRYCTIGALIALVPVLAYQISMFIRPAFEQRISRRRVYLTSFISLILALAGAAFGFGIILPAALHFFAGFQMEGLQSLISADSYLTLVTNILITFVIAFQIPLIVSFIDHIKPLKPSQLLKAEKWVVLASLIVSFLVPFAWDMTTSLLIAAPIVVLYNLAIVGVLLQHAWAKTKRKPTPSNALEAVEDVIEEVITEVSSAKKPKHTKKHVAAVPMAIKPVEVPAPPKLVEPTQRVKAMDILPPIRPAPRLVPPHRNSSIVPPTRTVEQPVSRGRLITDITPPEASPASA